MEETTMAVVPEVSPITSKDIARVAKFCAAKAGVVGLKVVSAVARGPELYYGCMAAGAQLISDGFTTIRELSEDGAERLNEYAKNI